MPLPYVREENDSRYLSLRTMAYSTRQHNLLVNYSRESKTRPHYPNLPSGMPPPDVKHIVAATVVFVFTHVVNTELCVVMNVCHELL